jgi:class 3 adenylate cyclase
MNIIFFFILLFLYKLYIKIKIIILYKINQIHLLQQILPLNFDKYYLSKKRKIMKNQNGCILFTDIVSYCELAEKYTDCIIMLILNDMYTRFDKIIEKYQYIHKIETIGDSYMVVGDINNFKYNDKLYIEMINFAFDILKETKKIKTPNHKLDIRIGIHIGSYIISVLGYKNPRVCIIGKNINMCARLQSTASPDTIQISEELYKKINHEQNISFQKNENVFLKNIGIINTYTITKIQD